MFFIIKNGKLTSWDCVVHYYKVESEFIKLSALFFFTKENVVSSDCLRVHNYNGDREFIRFSALFIMKKRDVTSLYCRFCSLVQMGKWIHQTVSVSQYYKGARFFIRLLCSIIQMGTWYHQNICDGHYYKRECDFIRLFALFIITDGNVTLEDCLRCLLLKKGNVVSWGCLRFSLLHGWKLLHQIVCVVHYYKGERDFIRLRCSSLQMGTWLHQFALLIITNRNVTSLDFISSLLLNLTRLH